MTGLVNLVMQAAAAEVLHEQADHIECEMERLLAEVKHATVEDPYYGVLWERFMELLKRRGEVARKALILLKARLD
jgi:hypothetical protein